MARLKARGRVEFARAIWKDSNGNKQQRRLLSDGKILRQEYDYRWTELGDINPRFTPHMWAEIYKHRVGAEVTISLHGTIAADKPIAAAVRRAKAKARGPRKLPAINEVRVRRIMGRIHMAETYFHCIRQLMKQFDFTALKGQGRAARRALLDVIVKQWTVNRVIYIQAMGAGRYHAELVYRRANHQLWRTK